MYEDKLYTAKMAIYLASHQPEKKYFHNLGHFWKRQQTRHKISPYNVMNTVNMTPFEGSLGVGSWNSEWRQIWSLCS